MEIGHGCFLMRPARRQNFVEQPSGSEVSPTGDIAEAVKVEGDAEPNENASETDRVEIISGSGSEDGLSLPRNDSPAGEGEGGILLPEEGSVGTVDDAAGEAADVVRGELGEACTGAKVDSISPENVNHSRLTDDTDDETSLIHSDEQDPDPTESEESANEGNAGDNPKRNNILRALIQDMTRAGESSGMPSVGNARSRYDKLPGPSIIVILDSPLMSPADPWLSPTNGPYSWVSQHASDLVLRRNEVRKGADAHAETPRVSQEISPPPLAELCDFEHQDDGDIRSDDQHPAGLGDPKEALEALFSWVEEGGMSHPGGREVILVCGSDPQGRTLAKSANKTKRGVYDEYGPGGGASGGSETESADSSAREGGVMSRTQSPVSGRSSSDKDLQEDTREDKVDVIEEAKPAPNNVQIDSEPDMNFHEREGCSTSGPTIRQIVLGKPLSPNVLQALKPHAGEEVVLRALNRLRGEGENIAEKGRNDYRSLPKQAPFSETHPRSAKNSRQPIPATPSTVLLEVRPTMQIAGEPRVAVTFPRPKIPAIAPADRRNATKPNSIGAHEGAANTGGEELVQHQQQLPRVIMGPVVGRVGPCSAVVLVEVDIADARAAALGETPDVNTSDIVGVQLTDALSGRRHEVTGGRWTGNPGSGPRLFEFETLTPGRRYAIRLMGVRKRDQVSML